MPVRSTPDGQYVKPLVSYLILDMDGRLNINAHGVAGETPNSVSLPTLFQGGAGPGSFVPGLGLGPAEISLGVVLPATQTNLIAARYASPLDAMDDLPGEENEFDRKSLYRLTGYPDAPTGRHFFSELDLTGNFAVGFIDPSGGGGLPQDAFFPSLVPETSLATPITQSLTDSPYEADLSGRSSAHDSLFDETQLERFLRPNYRDSILLSNELTDLITADVPPNDPQADARGLLTTASFEVPAIPSDLNQRLFDVLVVSFTAANNGTPPDAAQLDTIAGTMAVLLSPELRRGEPMNLNRLFGDGFDNNTNGVIDEPSESEVEGTIAGLGPDVQLDVDNNGVLDNTETLSGLRARANFARRLFTLMVLLTEYEDRDRDGITLFDSNGMLDAGDFFDFNGDGGNANAEDIWAHRRMLAQWCINVVDFRDPDSVMTPFEIDLDPFDVGGWEVDGDPGTTTDASGTVTDGDVESLGNFLGLGAEFPDYVVLWGTERPELLITETSALHDVKLQDRASDSGSNAQVGAMTDPDDDLDSAFLPVASAFFELTNPWLVRDEVRNATAPSEFYDIANGVANGVDLKKRAADATDGAPVWRLVVVDPDVTNAAERSNPRNFNSGDFRNAASFEDDVDTAIASDSAAIVRYVYFLMN